MKYLFYRDKCWLVRIAPKKELLQYLPLKTKEYTKSLGSVSESHAQWLAITVISQCLSEIEKAKELMADNNSATTDASICLLYTSPSPRD